MMCNTNSQLVALVVQQVLNYRGDLVVPEKQL